MFFSFYRSLLEVKGFEQLVDQTPSPHARSTSETLPIGHEE